MTIGIACDHHGVDLKKQIIDYLSKNYTVINYGPDQADMVDYPDYAFTIGEAVQQGKIDVGILLCNSGIGMSIACNKVKGVRCAKIDSEYDAQMCKRDNNANVIAVSARKPLEQIINMIEVYLRTNYENIERYNRRIEKIDNYINER